MSHIRYRKLLLVVRQEAIEVHGSVFHRLQCTQCIDSFLPRSIMNNSSFCNGFAPASLIALSSSNAVSVFVCLLAAVLVCALKVHKKTVYRLALYQVLASLVYAGSSVCQILLLYHHASLTQNDESELLRLCQVLVFTVVFASWMKVCFASWVAFHLFIFAVFHKNMKQLEVLYVVSSLLVAAVLACVPFATHSYGLQGSVCWIQSWKDNCPTNVSVVGVVEQFQLTYGPSMAVLLIVSVAMVVMVIAIFCRSRKYHDGQNSKVLQQLLPLAVYPLLFFVFTIPPFVNCLYGTRTTAYALSIMSAVSVASWSFFTGISLIVHILEAKLRAYCKKRYTYKHLAYIGVDGEGTAIPTSDTSSTSRPTCTFVLPADNLARTSTYM